MENGFSNAVSETERWLKSKDIQSAIKNTRSLQVFSMVNEAKRSLPGYDEKMKDMPIQVTFKKPPYWTLSKLLKESSWFPPAFNALRQLAAGLVEADEEMPQELAQWLVDFLKGNLEPPATPRNMRKKLPGDRFWRDFYIWSAVENLIENGFKPTSDRSSRSQSACDVVAVAMRKLGLHPMSADEVHKIWNRLRDMD